MKKKTAAEYAAAYAAKSALSDAYILALKYKDNNEPFEKYLAELDRLRKQPLENIF